MARVEKITWTIEVSRDLENIFDFYVEKSSTAAGRIIEDIISQVENFKFSKQHQTDELNPKYRRIVIGHHKILHRIQSNEVFVLRAFDTRSDPNKQIIIL